MTTLLKKISIASLIGLSLTTLPAMANDDTLGTYGFDDEEAPACASTPLPTGASFAVVYPDCGYTQGLAVIKKDDKYGFVDESGKLVIPAIYQEAHPFSDNLALIKQADKYGYIDKSGKIAIKPQYTDAWGFWEGRAKIEQNGKYGFIDTTGKIVIKPTYTMIGDWFEDGLVLFKQGNQYGFLDKSGKVAIKPQFDSAKDFAEGRAAVSKKTGKKDADGEELHQFGFIDKAGKVVIPIKYDLASDFVEGAAFVIEGEQVYFIDKDGKPTKMPNYN